MKLSVLHRTTFHYGAPVIESVNTLHLQPRDFAYQKTLSSFIRVIPATRLRCFDDLYQNITHHFQLSQSHSKLEIESRIKVLNQPLDISDESRSAGLTEYLDPEIREIVWPYLQESRRVSRSPLVWRTALDVTGDFASVYEKSNAIMGWIHREFVYEPGATSVKAHLEESFSVKRGVCQDFTHVMLGMCRVVGVSARYASGYIYNGPLDSLVGAQASHAWCEVYLPGAGWKGFDPTCGILAAGLHVRVAAARNPAQVTPIRGSYLGDDSIFRSMEVNVNAQTVEGKA